MKELRLRPKSDFINTADWHQLYILTEHWKSNMEFKAIEIDFLTKLMGKYFIWMTEENNFSSIQNVLEKVKQIRKQQLFINESIDIHLKNILKLIDSKSNQKEQLLRDEHTELEDKIASFSKEYRIRKKEVFNLTENVLESEKLRHLLHQ